MKLLQKLTALAMALCLCAASASAAGLDGILSYYMDVNTDTHFSVSAELETVMPFGEATIEKLNGVLRHMTLDASVAESFDGDLTTLGISVDGDSAFTISQRRGADGYELESSLLPNRTLQGDEDILNALFASDKEEPAFDTLAAISEAQGVYKELTDGIMPYAEEKKANYKIKSIATAKWSRVARLTPEQSAELLPQIAAVLGCGMDEGFRKQLESMTCLKNFTVALYRDKGDGRDMAVYMKGDVEFADESTRSLSYQWAFTDGGTERKDTYKLELKKKKGTADNRVINATFTQKTMSDRFSLSGKTDITLKQGKTTVATTKKHDLEGKATGDKRTFEGTLSDVTKTTKDGKTETVTSTHKPDLTLTSAEGSGALSGSVSVETLRGKSPQLKLKLTFGEGAAERLTGAAKSGTLFAVSDDDVVISMIDPESGIAMQLPEPDEADKEAPAQAAPQYAAGEPPLGYESYSAPVEPQTISLTSASRETLDELTDEMAQRLAGALLIRLAKLPAEDAALITDAMTEEDAQAFMSLLQGL